MIIFASMLLIILIISIMFGILDKYNIRPSIKYGVSITILVIFCVAIANDIERKNTPKYFELDLSIFEEENIAKIDLAVEDATDVIFEVNQIVKAASDGVYKIHGESEDGQLIFIAPMSLEDAASIQIGDKIRVRGMISVNQTGGKYYITVGNYTEGGCFSKYKHAKIVEIL